MIGCVGVFMNICWVLMMFVCRVILLVVMWCVVVISWLIGWCVFICSIWFIGWIGLMFGSMVVMICWNLFLWCYCGVSCVWILVCCIVVSGCRCWCVSWCVILFVMLVMSCCICLVLVILFWLSWFCCVW